MCVVAADYALLSEVKRIFFRANPKSITPDIIHESTIDSGVAG